MEHRQVFYIGHSAQAYDSRQRLTIETRPDTSDGARSTIAFSTRRDGCKKILQARSWDISIYHKTMTKLLYFPHKDFTISIIQTQFRYLLGARREARRSAYSPVYGYLSMWISCNKSGILSPPVISDDICPVLVLRFETQRIEIHARLYGMQKLAPNGMCCSFLPVVSGLDPGAV